jgi:hypothetical protein
MAAKTLLRLPHAIQHRILFNMSQVAVSTAYIFLLMGTADPMTTR